MTVIVQRGVFSCDAEALFRFHLEPRNIPAISLPLPRATVQAEPRATRPGDLQVLWLSVGPLRTAWDARITRVDERPETGTWLLEDVQERGPFRYWRHQHQVFDSGERAVLKDVVEFRFFPGAGGEFLDWLLVRPAIKVMFWYRHRQTRRLMKRG